MNLRKAMKAASQEVPAEVEQPAPDELAGAISSAMRGMHTLREENASLREQLTGCNDARTRLESQVGALKAQLDNERAERRHYHSLSNEIITRLDIVGRTVDDVVRAAHSEIARVTKEPTALPELKIPNFLKLAAEPKQEEAEVEPEPVA